MTESINRFMPFGEIRESREVIVDAPNALVYDVIEHFDPESVAAIRWILWMRAAILKAPRSPIRGSIAERMKGSGWGLLAAVGEHELVMGTVGQPWPGGAPCRAIPPEQFAAFNEPDLVKIAWTIEAEPMTSHITRLSVHMRAGGTDDKARKKLTSHWVRHSAGYRLMRRFMLRGIKRQAEARFKAETTAVSTAAPQH